ncbi:MAG: urease accessory protein UreD [Thiohalocapsa sp.]|nr:urease accessory protein UreD [Thiohalocapsa sp.]
MTTETPEIPIQPAPAGPEGWRGELDLVCAPRAGRTVLAHKRQLGPLTVQRAFHPEGDPCHLYLLHPPGGVVGGDVLRIRVHASENAHALITTPGAAKFYRSAGARADQVQRLEVAAGAVLEWLPLENIVFPGARAGIRTEVDLAPESSFIGWDILSLGRPVIRERFDAGELSVRLQVRRGGRLLLSEHLRVHDPAHLDGRTGLRGFPVTGTFVATSGQQPDAADLAAAREVLAASCTPLTGVTLVDGLLVARALAATTEPIQQVFCALWSALRPRLLARAPCPPRIWAT